MTPYQRMRRQKAIESAILRKEMKELEEAAHRNPNLEFCKVHPFWIIRNVGRPDVDCPFCRPMIEVPF